MATLRSENEISACMGIFFFYDDKGINFITKGQTMTKENISINSDQIKAVESLMECDENQIKVCEKLLSCIFKPGFVSIETSYLQDFLKSSKKIMYKTAFIDEATKEEIEETGLLSEELHSANKYFISVEAGNYMTFTDIDVIASVFRDFEGDSYFAVGSVSNEGMKDRFKINLFISE